MPIIDVNGNPLAFHLDLEDSISTIEFGAGKGCFGKKEFPLCYTTDKDFPSGEHFSEFPDDYESRECHYLDGTCDYFNLEFNSRKFDHILLCNPYGLGFSGRNNTKHFLEVANTILNPNGLITILGNSTNRWSTFSNFEKYYSKLLNDNEIEAVFTYDFNNINDDHPYRANHSFYKMDFQERTYPNELIQIRKIA